MQLITLIYFLFRYPGEGGAAIGSGNVNNSQAYINFNNKTITEFEKLILTCFMKRFDCQNYCIMNKLINNKATTKVNESEHQFTKSPGAGFTK